MRKINTLKKNYEFRNVLSKGKFYCGKYITVYISKNRECKNIIGIAVNTKVAKAVTRNRIKRLIRENYKLMKNDIISGNNIVFLWNKNAIIKDATFYNIKDDINRAFKKANILK